MGRFAGAIASTMQNWVDNAQMRMPEYRDRIVTVYLWSDQGGMNLDMDNKRIGELRACGEGAAGLLLKWFFCPPAEGWRNHRWVRYRSLMAMLQRVFEQLDGAWERDPGPGIASYPRMADGEGRPRSYPLSAGAQPWVQARSAELAAAWRGPVLDGHNGRSVGSFEDDEPRPRPVWRAQPEL